ASCFAVSGTAEAPTASSGRRARTTEWMSVGFVNRTSTVQPIPGRSRRHERDGARGGPHGLPVSGVVQYAGPNSAATAPLGVGRARPWPAQQRTWRLVMVSGQGKVVVGFDASDESRVAVRWAIAVANRRKVPLLVVHATGLEDPGPTVYRAGVAVMSRARAQEIAEGEAALARESAEVEVEAVGVERGAVAAMVDYSQG